MATLDLAQIVTELQRTLEASRGELEAMWRRRSQAIIDEMQRRIDSQFANLIRGGKLNAANLSGTVPLASLRAHASTHKSGGSDTITPFGGEFSATDFVVSGLTGAVAGARLVGATSSGAPASGTFLVGDVVVDRSGSFWICTVAGSPGTWVHVSGGGGGSGNVTYRTVWASPPGSPASGDLWFPSDSEYTARYNGTLWDYRYLNYPVTLPPAAASWTWDNQASATISDGNGAVWLTTAGTGLSLAYKSLTAPKTIIALVEPFFTGGAVGGIGFRNSSSGKILMFGWYTNSGLLGFWAGHYNTAAGGLASSPLLGSFPAPYRLVWLKLADDGTNLNASFSFDTVNYKQLYTETRASFLGTPDGAGIGAGSVAGQYISLKSWSVA